MLILSRRTDEAVRLGDNIRVVVLSTDGETVKLGIEAPADVAILREEIIAAVADENRRARADESARLWLGSVEGPNPIGPPREEPGRPDPS